MWLNVDKAAQLLKVSRRTIYNMIRNGKLQHKKKGHSSFVWIEKWQK
jgi:excisionase family DNA binding protein